MKENTGGAGRPGRRGRTGPGRRGEDNVHFKKKQRGRKRDSGRGPWRFVFVFFVVGEGAEGRSRGGEWERRRQGANSVPLSPGRSSSTAEDRARAFTGLRGEDSTGLLLAALSIVTQSIHQYDTCAQWNTSQR